MWYQAAATPAIWQKLTRKYAKPGKVVKRETVVQYSISAGNIPRAIQGQHGRLRIRSSWNLCEEQSRDIERRVTLQRH